MSSSTNKDKLMELATQKLPKSSVSRLGLSLYGTMTFWRESELDVAYRDGTVIGVTAVSGYHLEVVPGFTKDHDKRLNVDTAIQAHKIILYAPSLSELKAKYNGKAVSLYNKTGMIQCLSNKFDDSIRFDKIINKITEKRVLNKQEIDFLFEKINTDMSIDLTSSLINNVSKLTRNDNKPRIDQTTNPLLKVLDEHLVELCRTTQVRGKVNAIIFADKIALTRALIHFVENPSQNTWSNVRSVMHTNPRYGFSWTGQSQTDTYLNTIRLIYQPQIKSFDERYDQNDSNHAKNSWEQFFYHVGILNYIFSIPASLYTFFTNIVNSIRILSISADLNSLSETIQDHGTFNDLQKENLKGLISALVDYASDATDETMKELGVTNITRDEIDLIIENFEQHLNSMSISNDNLASQNIKNQLKNYYKKSLTSLENLVLLPLPALKSNKFGIVPLTLVDDIQVLGRDTNQTIW